MAGYFRQRYEGCSPPPGGTCPPGAGISRTCTAGLSWASLRDGGVSQFGTDLFHKWHKGVRGQEMAGTQREPGRGHGAENGRGGRDAQLPRDKGKPFTGTARIRAHGHAGGRASGARGVVRVRGGRVPPAGGLRRAALGRPPADWTKTDLGAVEDAETSFSGSPGRCILTGNEYYCWDGEGQAEPVEGMCHRGHRHGPLRRRHAAGEREQAQREAAAAVLPGRGRTGCSTWWRGRLTRCWRWRDRYFLDLRPEGRKPHLASAPAQGVNTVTITWRKGSGDRGKVAGMRFAEMYNGASTAGYSSTATAPTRPFTLAGRAGAALRGVLPGSERHGGGQRQHAHHRDDPPLRPAAGVQDRQRPLLPVRPSPWRTAAAPAFYANPLNREIGCAAPGQARLVDNDPGPSSGGGVYQWSLTVGASRDERNAKRLSDRVEATLAGFDLERTAVSTTRRSRSTMWSAGSGP